MADSVYDPSVIEARWQQYWDSNRTNAVDLHHADNPYYVLMMFPYPSAEGLHVGNVFAFTGADIQGRYRRLKGHQVFEPLGFDAFGIHSENFAMKINRHPADLIPANIARFRSQLRMMGLMVDWEKEVDTTTPAYYRWTQWVFLQLYKAGYVYRDEKELNFCPQCGTVISDEQVNPDGTCERHGDTKVERRKLPCWFLRITDFAERLLNNQDWLDWSERTKLAQRNWLGVSRGAEIDFAVVGHSEKIRVFTTRPDTLFGATFLVLAPDHPAVEAICSPAQASAVRAYRIACGAKTDEERMENKDKTGVDTGARATNPATGVEIPVFVADYVLLGYGTGAIMAVPGGDHRDFAFATKFNLPVLPIIDPRDNAAEGEAYAGPAGASAAEQAQFVRGGRASWSGPGAICNSANSEVSLNGLAKEEAVREMIAWLEKKSIGTAKTTIRLRDWGISRQRYWGPPVPIIYDEDGNAHPVPEEQLPVTLPPLMDFRPKGDGRGPLAGVDDWVNVEIGGKKFRRDTDVMDNFLDSAWYYLRYPSADDDRRAWDPALIEKWLPVDMYIGGNEHAVLHLLYTRFLCMALSEAGVLRMGSRPEMRDPAEPFRVFRAHGLLIREGSKMSKSKGNVVNPDEYVTEWGADTLRMYLMFLGPYLQGGDFRDKDIQGVRRFLNRIHSWYAEGAQPLVGDGELPRDLLVKVHQTIRKVGEDLESLSYNTAIAALMELHNAVKAAAATSTFIRESITLMLAPFAPHLAEELWQEQLGKKGSVFNARWPKYDPAMTVLEEVEIVLQINGKIRDRIMVPNGASPADLERIARESPIIAEELAAGKTIRRVVPVPGRLVNVIVG